MEAATLQAAAIAYGAYRGFAGGLHPVTGRQLPVFDQLELAAKQAWGRVAIAMKVHWAKATP